MKQQQRTAFDSPLLKITQLGHPTLRGGVQPVSAEELSVSEVQHLLDQLIETMRDADGVGIAAPQVNVSKAIVVIEVKPDNPRYPGRERVPLTVIVNPEIEHHSESLTNDWEGCLSVPGLRGFVPRWDSLLVSGMDRFGQPIRLQAEGFFARVIQHEVDHLNGLVYLDRMETLKTLTHLKEFELFWKTT